MKNTTIETISTTSLSTVTGGFSLGSLFGGGGGDKGGDGGGKKGGGGSSGGDGGGITGGLVKSFGLGKAFGF